MSDTGENSRYPVYLRYWRKYYILHS